MKRRRKPRPKKPQVEPPLPGETTRATPGSEEKLCVMEARLAAGEQLFHPGDRRVYRYDQERDLADLAQLGKVRVRLRAAPRTGVQPNHYRNSGMFRARVWVKELKRQITLGYFPSEAEALEAVQRAQAVLAGPDVAAIPPAQSSPCSSGGGASGR